MSVGEGEVEKEGRVRNGKCVVLRRGRGGGQKKC